MLTDIHSLLDSPAGLSGEKLRTSIFKNASDASLEIAGYIASLIKSKEQKGENCVLGLATGSSPKNVYHELVRLHHNEGLSFRNVISFNLDEYYPMEPKAVQSYHRYMYEMLFNHIDIPQGNIFIPDGNLPLESVTIYCIQFEDRIREFGGIDLQLLGIGRTGHIGFNEPGSSSLSKTRVVNLNKLTRADAANDFNGLEKVPRKAITMGIGTILSAREIILMAWGEAKSEVLRKCVEGPVSEEIPATWLQEHPEVRVYVDLPAASRLTRVKTPWLADQCEWNARLIRKAVIWLCQLTDKPILKLTDKDYGDHGLDDLLKFHGNSYELNIKVFNDLQHTVTGWPGGKPGEDDTFRPERSRPAKKRVLIFSPHPDDDVISMGGTFMRLHDQGHEVHVAYQTSGDIAVFDDDVISYLDFIKEFNGFAGLGKGNKNELYEEVTKKLLGKRSDEVDDEFIRFIKALIRRVEARAGCRFVGIPEERVHFLNLPFYQTGKALKDPIGERDIAITLELIESIRPHQIFAAGDLSDPHGTHEMCLDAILKSIDQLKVSNVKWLRDCYLWLYRGAWQEWDVADIDMAVPLSPGEVIRKRKAIFKHQSQKDTPVFPGSDPREFWQRAEDRSRETARLYDQLGFSEYEAIEAFKRYDT